MEQTGHINAPFSEVKEVNRFSGKVINTFSNFTIAEPRVWNDVDDLRFPKIESLKEHGLTTIENSVNGKTYLVPTKEATQMGMLVPVYI